MPSTAPPVPTAKTTPCSSADQGGRGWRGQPRGKVSEKGGEERERPSSAGRLLLGCEDKPRHKAGSGASPLGSPPGCCHLRNLLIDFHQKVVAGEAWWDKLARLPASSGINGTSATLRTLPFSKTSLSKEAEPAIPQILMTLEGFKSASSSLALVPLVTGLPIPLALGLGDCSPPSQASQGTPPAL